MTTPARAAPASSRVRSVDLLRGAACVLMAIDHVRVYSGLPTGGDPALFLTRWVTHFVAPTFVFFAGTGAFFLGRALGDLRALARFLVTRGLLLVALELTVIRFLWSFSPDLTAFKLAGVIWMLGWCMVFLGVICQIAPRIKPRTLGWIGIGIVLPQQLFGFLPRALPGGVRSVVAPIWAFIYPSGAEAPFGMNVLYVIVPWIGVMAAGYGLGVILERDEATRRRTLHRIGIGMTAVFLIVATIVAVSSGGAGGEGGDESASAIPLWVRILGQQKYPASQLFLLMTLGPAIAALPWAERARSWWADALVTIGRVPLFYYLLHLPAIHIAAMVVNKLRAGVTGASWYMTAPYTEIPDEHTWSLATLYLVWAIVLVGVLYPACRWYARVKATRPRWWMRYI